VFGQLFHGGREIMDTEDGTLAVAWAPSPVPTERFHVIPRAMTEPLIGEILEGFGSAAFRLQTAGLDGVEVVASHGYSRRSSSIRARTCAPTAGAGTRRGDCGSCARRWRPVGRPLGRASS